MSFMAFNAIRFIRPARCVSVAALVLACAGGALAQQAPPIECPDGGRLEQGPAAPADAIVPEQRAFTLIRQPDFAARHRALVGGEEPWVQELRGPASPSRFYVHPGGRVLVFDSCKPRDCGDNALYGAVEAGGEGKERYGLRIFERQVPRDLGNLSPAGWAAIACARAVDVEAARQTLESIGRESSQ